MASTMPSPSTGRCGAAFDVVGEVLQSEQIQAAHKRCGRFIMTRSRRQYEALARALELRRQHLGEPFEMVPRARIKSEIASDADCGGAIIPDLIN
jgi:hypothetical protein